MGLKKWMLKNAPGSIGSTAKVWSKFYLDTLGSNKDQESIDSSFLHTFLGFTMAFQRFRDYKPSNPENVLKDSENCLALFILILILDTPEYKNEIFANSNSLDLSCEIIYECVSEVAKGHIKYDYKTFRTKVTDYILLRSKGRSLLDYLDKF
jgi:hypothetical protein